jgi:hypothetical protein
MTAKLRGLYGILTSKHTVFSLWQVYLFHHFYLLLEIKIHILQRIGNLPVRSFCSTLPAKSLETKYDFMAESGILKRINRSSVDQLVKYEFIVLNISCTLYINATAFRMSFNFHEAEELKKYRKENGPFRKIADLLNVPGMTEEKIEEVGTHITTTMQNDANAVGVITPYFPDTKVVL